MPKTSLKDLVKYPYTMNEHDLVYLPKSLSLISSLPCFDTQRQVLRHLYNHMFAKSDNKGTKDDIKIPKRWLETMENVIIRQQNGKDTDFDELWQKEYSDRKQLYLKPVFNEDCYVLKEAQLKEFYISVMFSLMEVESDPFEKILVNSLKPDQEEQFARYRTPAVKGIDLPQVDYRYLFQRFSPENIMLIIKCLLLEKQMIFFSKSPGDIPIISEILISLFRPL